MKKHPLITTALFLSFSLYTACGDPNTPSTLNPNPSIDANGNITPFPKGPKELDGVHLPNSGPLSTDNGLNNRKTNADASLSDSTSMIGIEAPEAPGAGGAIAESAPSQDADVTSDDSAMPKTPEPTATPQDDVSNTENSADPAVVEAQNFFYFSYDDSASTAGVEQTKFALERSNPTLPNPSWVRPWEFLNYETFTPQKLTNLGTFQVAMWI